MNRLVPSCIFWVCVVSVAFAGGCETSGASNSQSNAVAQQEIVNFANSYGSALCEKSARCGVGILPASEVACRDMLIHAAFLPPMALLQEGRQLDQGASARCLAALSDSTCDAFERMLNDDDSPLQRDCVQSIKGRQAEGASCSSGLDCAPGLRCTGSDEACGVCVPEGVSCGGTFCQRDQYCSEATRCEAKKPAQSPCAERGECAAGTFCVDATCQAGRALGESCDRPGYSYDPCEAGLSCHISQGGGEATCQVRSFRQGEGDPCNRSLLFCGLELRCDEVMGSCVPKTQDGQACSSRDECLGGSSCQGGTCRLKREDGKPCSDLFDCRSGLCQAGACQAIPVKRAACVGPAVVDDREDDLPSSDASSP